MKFILIPRSISGIFLLAILFVFSSYKHPTTRKRILDNHLKMFFYDLSPEQLKLKSDAVIKNQSSAGLNSLTGILQENEEVEQGSGNNLKADGGLMQTGQLADLPDGVGAPLQSLSKLNFVPDTKGFLGAPDKMIAAGMKYLVLCTDHYLTFYDKTGHQLPEKNNLKTGMRMNDFFAAFINDDPAYDNININKKMNIPAGCKINQFYDARVEYNSFQKRFFILAHVKNGMAGCLARFFAIAVSKTEDPRDGFYQWISTTRPYGDWPRISLNGNYFIYTWNGESQKDQPAAHIFSVSDLKSGNPNPAVWTFYREDFLNYGGGLTPINVPGAPSDVTYFLRLNNNPKKVQLYAFENTNSFSQKPSLMYSEQDSDRPFSMLFCSNMTYRNGKIYIACIQQVSDRLPNVRPGRTDIRVLAFPVEVKKLMPDKKKAIYFDLGTGPGHIDLVFGRNNPYDDKPGSEFSYEIPAITVNKDGDIIVVYARVPLKKTGDNYPDTRYTLIYHNEDKQRPSQLLHAGEFFPYCIYDSDHGDTQPTVIDYNDKPCTSKGAYVLDLACAVVDPEDDRSFWIIHNYAKKSEKSPFYFKDDDAGCYKHRAFTMAAVAKIKP